MRSDSGSKAAKPGTPSWRLVLAGDGPDLDSAAEIGGCPWASSIALFLRAIGMNLQPYYSDGHDLGAAIPFRRISQCRAGGDGSRIADRSDQLLAVSRSLNPWTNRAIGSAKRSVRHGRAAQGRIERSRFSRNISDRGTAARRCGLFSRGQVPRPSWVSTENCWVSGHLGKEEGNAHLSRLPVGVPGFRAHREDRQIFGSCRP